MDDWSKAVERLLGMADAGMLGAFGAVANWAYVTVTQPGRPVRIGLFMCNVIMSFYVGIVVGSFLGPDSPNRDGVILVCGFCAYPMLGLIEANFKSAATAFIAKLRR